MHKRLLLVGLALLASLSSPLLSENTGPAETPLSAPYRAKVEDAMDRGRRMFLYDQAAWHATDQMLADFNNSPDKRMHGYVVLPGEAGKALAVVFFGEVDGKQVEFARYEVETDKVVSRKVYGEGERPALSSLAERLIAARDTALDELVAQKYGFCNDRQANYVVLPTGDDGAISVYFLTPQIENGSYPLGGHYRIDIGADGKVVSSRRFMNSCFNVDLKNKGANGEASDLVGFFVTHLLDPQPTEIHFFASYYIPLEMMVGTTSNNLMWDIRQGRLVDVTKLPAKD